MKKEVELNSSLKLIAKTSIIVLIALILSKILTYAYRIVVARYFGPEVYGLFSLATMITGFFITFSSLGLIEGLLRFISLYRGKKQQAKINYLIKFTLITLFISGLLAAAILFFSSEFISINIFHNPNLIIYLKIFSFLIPISLFANIFLSVIRTYEKIVWYSFAQNILQNAAKIIFLILLILLGFNSNSIIFSYFLGMLMVLIFTYFYCKYKLADIFIKKILLKKQKKEVITNLFYYSWPIMSLSLIGGLLYWVDSFTIGYFKSVADVGFYNAAVPIAALFSVATEIFAQLFFPLITKEYSKNNFFLIKELSKQVGKWIFIINVPLFLIIILFPGAIINILFGEKYLIASDSLRILALSGLFTSISSISVNILSMMGKSKIILINTMTFSFINFLLDIVLVPKYGIIGAAITTTFASIGSGIVFIIYSNKYISIVPLRRKMIKIFFVALIPLFIVIIVKRFIQINTISFIIIGLFFILSYLILIYITKCFDKNDLAIINLIKIKLLKSIPEQKSKLVTELDTFK